MNSIGSKPNFTQQEFAKDKYECIQQAQQTKYRAQGATGYGIFYEPGSASSDAVTNSTLFKLCMEARGWSEILEENTVADNFTGRKTYTYTDGKYEGDFVNGKMTGKGIYTCSNGKQFTGNFENNQPIGFTINCAAAEQPTKPVIQNSVIPTSNSSSIQPTSEQSNKSETLYSQKLRDLKKLKDEGLLTDKEYEQKRKAIVDAM